MQLKTLAIAALALTTACSDDPTGPAQGMFRASVMGARTLEFEGESYNQLVFVEALAQGRYTIFMGSYAGERTHLVLIDCPDTQFFQPRTYTLGTSETGCRGFYRLLGGGLGGATLIEEFVSLTGTLTVTQVTNAAVKGTFQFTGDLSEDGQSNAPVTASGVFNSARFQ